VSRSPLPLAALAGLSLAAAAPARAEIVLLASGQTLKLESHRAEGELIALVLAGGGEVHLPPAAIRGFVPDEVIEEVAAAKGGEDIVAIVERAARRHGLEPALVLAVVSVESAIKPQAVSPKGAQGLMQLMPRTAASLGVEDAFDPEQNVDAGVRHLESLVRLYDGNLTRALAAYNAGQGAVARHGGVPPYRETRAYVKKVLERYRAKQGK
jgi:soluble lytic murein transglycosylase-like protein